MKRQILVLVLISSVLLAACGGAAAPAGTQPTAAPAADAPTVAPAAPADATAVALQATEEAGIVSKPIDGKENITWWTHNNPAFVAANKVKPIQATTGVSSSNTGCEYPPPAR